MWSWSKPEPVPREGRGQGTCAHLLLVEGGLGLFALCQDHARVGQPLQVVDPGGPSAQPAVELAVEPRLPAGIGLLQCHALPPCLGGRPRRAALGPRAPKRGGRTDRPVLAWSGPHLLSRRGTNGGGATLPCPPVTQQTSRFNLVRLPRQKFRNQKVRSSLSWRHRTTKPDGGVAKGCAETAAVRSAEEAPIGVPTAPAHHPLQPSVRSQRVAER
jgi:hypothetical protein